LKSKKQRKQENKEKNQQRKRENVKKYGEKKRETEETSLIPHLNLSSLESWPKDASHLFLDGNNMLYVCAPIRSLVIRRQFREAEEALRAFANEVAAILGLAQCVLLFDVLHSDEVQTEKFVVSSARPSYPTSDDLLVKWAEDRYGNNNSNPIRPVFVTSDVELKVRLTSSAQVYICKPKEWFLFGAKLLNSGNLANSLDEFMAKWLEQYQLNTALKKTLTIQNN